MNASDEKWSRLVTREALMAVAAPYASTLVNVPGYSLAKILATDHAAEACSDGNELPPLQNPPLWSPSKGRCRAENPLTASVTMKLSDTASALSKPVSRLC